MENAASILDLKLRFRDECYYTEILPVYNDDVMIPLGEFFYESLINYSTQSLDCNPIEYSMFVVSTTANEPVEIFWNLDYNDYEINPVNWESRGDYTVLVRSCVPVGTDKVCVISEPWTIMVYDPCKDTEILSSGFNYVMSAVVLDQDILNYGAQINLEGGLFKWPTSLDVYFGSDTVETCGTIEYFVEAATYPAEAFSTPLVYEMDYMLYLEPSAEYSPGIYGLNLVGKLDRYGLASAVPFTVEVLPCMASLSSASVVTPIEIYSTWYDLHAGTSILQTISELTQSPPCEFPYVTQLWYPDSATQ